MSARQGFRLHPLAGRDITGIWKYIADDNVFAAARVREEILNEIRAGWSHSRTRAIADRTSVPAPCASNPSVNT